MTEIAAAENFDLSLCLTPRPPTGACGRDSVRTIETQAECEAGQGVYQGEGDSNPYEACGIHVCT